MNLGYAHNVGTSGSILKMNGLTQNPANYARSKAMTVLESYPKPPRPKRSLRQVLGTPMWLILMSCLGLFAVWCLAVLIIAIILI